MRHDDDRSDHTVCFYDHESHLIAQLTTFVRDGLSTDAGVVVMATDAHLTALRCAIGEELFASPRLKTIDAADAIDAVVRDGQLCPDELARLFDALFTEPDRQYRVYGELVTVLAARGQLDVALALEAAAQPLIDRGVKVLCAYDVQHVRDEEGARAISALHTHTLSDRDRHADATNASAPLILIADDFDDARELYGEYLEYAGLRVVTAASGAEAVELCAAHVPDLILMDVRMPGMTGTEAMRLIRQHPAVAHVPILALTAHALDSERAAILADGFDGVISKPCLPDELLDILRTRLAEERVHERT